MNRARYIIHHHITGEPHYDLMIETGDSLATWRIPERDWPRFLSGERITIHRIENHRRDYLEYRGQVSDDRGTVIPVDRGTYGGVLHTDTGSVLTISGELTGGTLMLHTDDGHWNCIYHPGVMGLA